MVLRIPLEKKNLKTRSVAIFFVLIAVISLGCTEKLEEPIDKTSIYVYEEEMGQEGDPQEEISEFYDIVSSQTEGEQSGPPEFVPLKKYAVELDIDPDTGEVNIDTTKIYDSDGNLVDLETALAMQDNIVKDDAGKIITDAAQLDIHIKPIGKDKYEISLAQQWPVDDGVWKVSYDVGNRHDGKSEYNDNVITIGDHDDIYAGFADDHLVIVIDEDAFGKYNGDFGIKTPDANSLRIAREDCTPVGDGVYVYLIPLSEMHEESMTVHTPCPWSEYEDGEYAQIRFIKESI
jgi:hypothetical protein